MGKGGDVYKKEKEGVGVTVLVSCSFLSFLFRLPHCEVLIPISLCAYIIMTAGGICNGVGCG
jgi:hypothetical protein